MARIYTQPRPKKKSNRDRSIRYPLLVWAVPSHSDNDADDAPDGDADDASAPPA